MARAGASVWRPLPADDGLCFALAGGGRRLNDWAALLLSFVVPFGLLTIVLPAAEGGVVGLDDRLTAGRRVCAGPAGDAAACAFAVSLVAGQNRRRDAARLAEVGRGHAEPEAGLKA